MTIYTNNFGKKICTCEAYLGKSGKPFPHRLDSGKCKELYNSGNDDTYREQPLVSRTNDYAARMNEYGLKETDFL